MVRSLRCTMKSMRSCYLLWLGGRRSWWFIVVPHIVYILSGTNGDAWSGFSIKAFENLWGFVRLSLTSAVILCWA
ncbi:hypothetical protein HN51_063396 [Arachis hypogaea]